MRDERLDARGLVERGFHAADVLELLREARMFRTPTSPFNSDCSDPLLNFDAGPSPAVASLLRGQLPGDGLGPRQPWDE
jgi:hypothetical protein